MVFVSFAAGAGSVTLYLIDQREAPVTQIGEPLRMANFEVGRFELTPRALRMLIDSAEKAAKGWSEAMKEPLPTIDQFNARAQMPNLQNLLQPPKPPDSAG